MILSGVIEYWAASDHSFPEAAVSFRMKMETDLFALAMAKATASSLAVSQDGSQFAAFCSDRCTCCKHDLYPCSDWRTYGSSTP